MGAEPKFDDLMREIKAARDVFGARLRDVESAVNDIFKRLNRPGLPSKRRKKDFGNQRLRQYKSDWACAR
jgi:hypothetical protein